MRSGSDLEGDEDDVSQHLGEEGANDPLGDGSSVAGRSPQAIPEIGSTHQGDLLLHDDDENDDALGDDIFQIAHAQLAAGEDLEEATDAAQNSLASSDKKDWLADSRS